MFDFNTASQAWYAGAMIGKRLKWWGMGITSAVLFGCLVAYYNLRPRPMRAAYDRIEIGMDCRQACNLIDDAMGQPHSSCQGDYRAVFKRITKVDAEIILTTDDYGRVIHKAYVDRLGRLEDVWVRLKVRLLLFLKGFST